MGLDRIGQILAEEDYPVESVEVTDQPQGERTGATAKDPVCGMDVDTRTARHTSEYAAETYYFCSAGCKRAFEPEPERYVQAGARSIGCACCS